MLRRATKRSSDNPKQDTIKTKKRSSNKAPLGTKRNKKADDEEKALEGLVLGKGEDIISHLKDSEPKKKRSKSLVGQYEEERKPVWEDDDDKAGSIELSKYSGLRQGKECRIRTDQYTTRLKSEFEKVCSTPNWAKLPSGRPVRRSSSDDDSDIEDLQQRTGNYLDSSQTLPRGLIQIKACPNANRDSPSQGRLTSVEFHPSAQVILTAGMNQTLSLFQVDGRTNAKIQSVFVDNFPIHSAHFSADGHEVIMGSKHKSFYYYDMIAGKIVNVPKIKGLEENNMKRLKVSPDGRYIAFLGSYGAIHLLSAKSKEWIHTLKMNGSVESVAFSHNGRTMYSHGDDGEVYVWDLDRRDCIHHFMDDGCIKGTAISISQDGHYLACGSQSGVVNIYETDTCMASKSPKPLREVKNLTTPCTGALFNSATEILALSSNFTERAVKLVHIPSMTVFSNYPDRLDGNLRLPECMDFSPNNGYFTIGTQKGTALLYRVKHYGNY